ncbi:hypothetical protein EV07_1629 [Prochlorococcus sp. MIT 0603]|nr:hypothetical protein EV07_1629 [Prochlorococcus sp. MIT 0603]
MVVFELRGGIENVSGAKLKSRILFCSVGKTVAFPPPPTPL